MEVFKIILYLFNLLLLIHSLYFGILGILPFLLKEKKIKKVENTKHKFRIIIAARNEEMVLKPLIKSIQKQKYDKNLYDIYVIPNNCIDNTKKVALEMNCQILEPNFSPKTKGEVLNFAFNEFKNDDSFDTYIIMDADNIIEPNFIKEINDKLNEGYKIVQGFRDTKNLYYNCITGSYAIFFYLQSLFLYGSRSRIGKSSTIIGTGYAVLKKFIDTKNYRASTVTEDIELTCFAALNNEKVGYARNAIFYDEQVTNFNVSMKQRKRWIQGSMQVWKKNYKKLLKQIKEKKSIQLIDQFFILTLPINQALCFLCLVLSYIFIIPYYYILFGIILGYIGEVLFSVFLIVYFKKNLIKILPAIMFFPIFHISWIPIYVYSVFNSKNVWEEIKHKSSIEIEDIIGE